MSRYVVTGAAGFIGSHLAERLLAQGHEVRSVDCFTDYYDPALKRENAVGLDVTNLDLAAAHIDLGGVDCVFHLAGQPGTRSFGPIFADYLRRNTLATQRLFETAAGAGEGRLRVVLVGVRRRRDVPDHRGDDPEAELALRGHEARL